MKSSAERFMQLCQRVDAVWMGIINATPDSFSDGGAYSTVDAAVARGMEMVTRGAHVLDVGGVSTRPGSSPVSEEEEIARIRPLLQTLRRAIPSSTLLSVDTFRPNVADLVAREGLVDIVNDVSASQVDAENTSAQNRTTAHVAAEFQLGLILMHMQGTPKTMQLAPNYKDCLAEVTEFLKARTCFARQLGVTAIAVDPGIGFGKRFEDNQMLLSKQGITTLTSIGYPVLIGLSRKRFLQEWFQHTGEDLSEPKSRDVHSKELEYSCLKHGARIIRSHRLPNEVQVSLMKESP